MNFRRAAVSWVLERKGPILLLFAGILGPLLLFGEIADEVMDREPLFFDMPIQLWARSWQSPGLDRGMLALSAFGSPGLMMTLCGVALGVLLWRNRRGDALFFFLAVGGALLMNVLAKLFFQRQRPTLWLSIDPRSDFSFPSGHAMGTAAVFAALVILAWNSRLRVPIAIGSVILVVMVGLSRVYLGVHYPSDVLSGWCAAVIWVLGLDHIRHLRRKVRQSVRDRSQTVST